MDSLLTTLQHRPYVALFLLTFSILSLLHVGVLRTLCWLAWGYFVAFVSEYSSIHNGFPYGLYHYIPEGFAGELVLGGIPVWDSISYCFVAYASYATAWFLLEPIFLKFQIDPHVSPSRPFALSLLGAFLMMLADGIIDPAANLGEKWFLGKVYYYPDGGLYFGVPLTNFAGWFLVGFIILFGWQLLEKFIFTKFQIPVWGTKRFPFQALLGPCFYFGILFFILVILFQIQAYSLLGLSGLWTLLIFFTVYFHGVPSHQRKEFWERRR